MARVCTITFVGDHDDEHPEAARKLDDAAQFGRSGGPDE